MSRKPRHSHVLLFRFCPCSNTHIPCLRGLLLSARRIFPCIHYRSPCPMHLQYARDFQNIQRIIQNSQKHRYNLWDVTAATKIRAIGSCSLAREILHPLIQGCHQSLGLCRREVIQYTKEECRKELRTAASSGLRAPLAMLCFPGRNLCAGLV